MGDQELPAVLVSGFEGPRSVCKDHVADLQKHFNLITMQEFLENKTKFSPKIQAVYVWAGQPVIDQELLQTLPSLKIIANGGVGLDHLDLKLIARFGVKVANTPKDVSNPTADMGMALLLASARRLVERHQLAHAADMTTMSLNWMGEEVTGATLGIIGMGTIGYKVAQRAKAFEMKILYHNRNRRNLVEEKAVGATYCEHLDDLLQKSDFVMLTVSLTPQTQSMIGKRELGLMKPTAILINIGRGLLVDQDALVEALQTGVIKAAALDVTYPEPLPRDHPLLKLKNVTLTLHIGSATHQSRRQMMKNMVGSILASFSGLPIPNERLVRNVAPVHVLALRARHTASGSAPCRFRLHLWTLDSLLSRDYSSRPDFTPRDVCHTPSGTLGALDHARSRPPVAPPQSSRRSPKFHPRLLTRNPTPHGNPAPEC
ncbi:PREDICTED: glyoxylate reductase/hydroxypyruvate reductase-like [Chrysochloris asiatica]|uniref:Glyoxylate reductase/hydroxypyruvate reductase n=1 Tax=Chrysochloris asiatica TaxID=185453 RepID=A0A9B0U2S7_CHRAS|nr:PREDICTED: glyoxylate reductase/hydroxypyruvate reductase-like [Chrysochloris asiatica]